MHFYTRARAIKLKLTGEAEIDIERVKASSAATLVAERYGWPRVFERLFGIYREVCANYASRRNASLIP